MNPAPANFFQGKGLHSTQLVYDTHKITRAMSESQSLDRGILSHISNKNFQFGADLGSQAAEKK